MNGSIKLTFTLLILTVVLNTVSAYEWNSRSECENSCINSREYTGIRRERPDDWDCIKVCILEKQVELLTKILETQMLIHQKMDPILRELKSIL